MTDTARRRERGFALLIVLWTLVLLSLVVTAVIALGRNTTQGEMSRTRLAWARAQADSAIQTAMFHLLGAGRDRWVPDGRWHTLSEPDLTARVRAVIESGALNPNTAPPALLESVLLTLGVAAPDATSLARWIVNWRQPLSAGELARARLTAGENGGCMAPGRPFHSIDDLAVVPGMTSALLARLAPHLSFTQTRALGPDTTDPILRAAVARSRVGTDAGKPDLAPNGTAAAADIDDETGESATLVIDAEAPTTSGHTLRRRAVILTAPDHMPPFRVITLRSEDSEAPS
ncbi:type II secretion system protein GspK [Gluconacetobacter tumulisoli]|uniref:General secretion pathway protein GspK n=1 Tax=Gluconacetobacter tumulisoli TaxID=1286189 RepID=A0A7W4PKJ4_9PROT|nr:type II secretion system protein GspK [Gluconacetobacter tumulisoli]MBB2201457.1 hypothetical protein [Gluconacetobacter tumulisoli]